jgi:predicted ATP-grasp superfamily ATP-dependent carboligase
MNKPQRYISKSEIVNLKSRSKAIKQILPKYLSNNGLDGKYKIIKGKATKEEKKNPVKPQFSCYTVVKTKDGKPVAHFGPRKIEIYENGKKFSDHAKEIGKKVEMDVAMQTVGDYDYVPINLPTAVKYSNCNYDEFGEIINCKRISPK